MSGALNAVKSGELKPSEAIVKYGVPRQTLRQAEWMGNSWHESWT